ncbi:MAG: glycosyltransferase family 2 protein [Anaerolineae bacterium]
MGDPDLSIVVVSWNVRDLLDRCLLSVRPFLERREGRDLQAEVIVVDNRSEDGGPEMVQAKYPEVRLIETGENLGFTRGNNLGISESRGRYLLLLNPDTEVRGEAPGVMVSYLEDRPRVGIVGPQLLNPDGTVQSSRRRFPTLATAVMESTVVQGWSPRNPVLARYYILDRPDDEIQEVDWLVGACLLVRRQAAEEVGPLDERFFMYSEELDWCRRMVDAGWGVVYLPTAQVLHHGGKSSEQVLPLRHIQFQRSKILYFRKHHGRLQAILLRLFLLANYAYLLLLEGVKGLLGHKRTLRRQRAAAYWAVLRSGLR